MAYGCEMGAKSSTLVTMIPKAVASGNCEVRPESTVMRVETDDAGRATGVLYVDAAGAEHRQRAAAVVLAANGAETPRLLLLSTSRTVPRRPRQFERTRRQYLMWNAHGDTYARFEHPLNEYKSVQVTRIVHDFYDSDPSRGFYGGGGIDARLWAGPLMFSLFALPEDGRSGARPTSASCRTRSRTQCPCRGRHLARTGVEHRHARPDVRDRWGRPALRATYRDHPDDILNTQFLMDRSHEIMEAAGAQKIWSSPAGETFGGAHLMGTAVWAMTRARQSSTATTARTTCRTCSSAMAAAS
jgi:choline dehydrogenase-like flavoprotein